jgi:pyruvate/2-oxoacid:ferredoxin oxidoreductase alpha subunit
MPVMIVYDAFFLSHTYEAVDIPSQEVVDRFLPPYKPEFFLNVDDPRAFYGLVEPAHYMELRYKMQKAMEEALKVIEDVDREFFELFGRKYEMVNEFMTDDAEYCLVTSGSLTGSACESVKMMREKGIPVGLNSIRTFRPFPSSIIRERLKKYKKVGVIDRNISFGAGGIFAQEIKASLYGEKKAPPIFSFIAGLGGRDVKPEDIEEMVRIMIERDEPERDIIWMGLKE